MSLLSEDEVLLAKLSLEEYGSSEQGHEVLYDPSEDEYHVVQDEHQIIQNNALEDEEDLVYPDEECTVSLNWFAKDQECYTNALIEQFLNHSMEAFESADAEVADKEALYHNQSNIYADLALEYYNANDGIEVKYELVKATESCYIMDVDGTYVHLNFIAKAKQEESKEQLFFAEVSLKNPSMTTCLSLLEGVEQIGGYACNTDKQTLHQAKNDEYCYACGDAIMHPCSDTALYNAGHYTLIDFYNCC